MCCKLQTYIKADIRHNWKSVANVQVESASILRKSNDLLVYVNDKSTENAQDLRASKR